MPTKKNESVAFYRDLMKKIATLQHHNTELKKLVSQQHLWLKDLSLNSSREIEALKKVLIEN